MRTLSVTCTESGPVLCPVIHSLTCTYLITVSLIPEFMVIKSGCPTTSPPSLQDPCTLVSLPGEQAFPWASAGSLP